MTAHKFPPKLSDESPNAYAAFLDYMSLEVPRSIPALLEFYGQNRQKTAKRPKENTLYDWHAQHHWKRREAEYIDAMAEEVNQQNREWYVRRLDKVKQQAEKLDSILIDLIQGFSRFKVSKVRIIPDAKQPGQSIKIVTRRFNMTEFRSLVETYNRHHSGLKDILGLETGTSVSIKTAGKGSAKVKAYVTVTDAEGNTFNGPDDWPDELPELDDEEETDS
jgi:hypothetical protein